MHLFGRHNKSNLNAQAFVEFALVLPALLLVVYGMLEVGRLLLSYSIVATASREAVRYGSATGINTSTGTLRFMDCAGIQQAAHKVDFLGIIDDVNITIQYDHGPGTSVYSTCPPAGVSNGDRISVQVVATFTPIVPIVPLSTITIKSSSSRTILVNILVAGTAVVPPTVVGPPPTPTLTPTNTSTPTKTNTPTPTATASKTPTPTKTFTPTNTSQYTLTPSFTPTNTPTPTITYTPTATTTPTSTYTPTSTPTFTATSTPTSTPVNCSYVTHGGIVISGNAMQMAINNGTGSDLIVSQIFVQWNNLTGSSAGDHTLHLLGISLAGVPFWSGNEPGPSFTVGSNYGLILPVGTSQIIFTFDKSYDYIDGTERITVQFANNGCGRYTLDSSVVTPTPTGP